MDTKQKYKTIYFSDHPGVSAKERSLTIAFGKRYNQLYETVKNLSSAELRHLLGFDLYKELGVAANQEELPVNTYCLRQISKSLRTVREASTPAVYDYIFDPVTVTFKGGAKEPFVRWYPYLEGYSPEYVESILKKYTPNAQRILDPFAGTATTAFAVSKVGREALFCEVNPVLQFVALTKIRTRMLKSGQRKRLAVSLGSIASSLANFEKYAPDFELDKAYRRVFGYSKFFDDDVYDRLLRFRAWVDDVNLNDSLLADLFMVAIVSSLVPVSRMKRAGDLRYKTNAELVKEKVNLLPYLSQSIHNIANDIDGDVNGLQTEPILICESARSLAYLPNLSIDAVITSPPYVNGTNYFRNTKIELWFMRCLQEIQDLARFRAEAVTAGINDVTVANSSECSNSDVRAIVEKLKSSAYDMRIPKMIDSYFSEMASIFETIKFHLNKDAIVAIDIGDSEYGGIHVPVDELLSKCLLDVGLVQQDQVVLRERQSRSGSPLKQVLQIYRYPGQKTETVIKLLPYWKHSWDLFKNTLPHQQEPYSKRNWGHERHSLCSYLGKLKPAIAHNLVKTFVPLGGKMLDPFAGVGTIPFEAALQGKLSYGFDISPSAVAIATGKVRNPSRDGCQKIIKDLADYLSSNDLTPDEISAAHEFGFNGKIADFYEGDTLREVLLARRYFKTYKPANTESFFVLASLLHILHGNRPYALSRRSHPITPYKPQGDFEYHSLVKKLIEKVERSLESELPNEFKEGNIYLQDATGWWPREVDELDAIITSPPFFDSTRFYLANWIRLWFCGWNSRDFETRPLGFVEERQKKSFDVYVPVLRQARERLKPHGVIVLHLGKSVKCDMAQQMVELGRKWFRFAEVFDENVSHCESHGIRDKGTVNTHQYLVLY